MDSIIKIFNTIIYQLQCMAIFLAVDYLYFKKDVANISNVSALRLKSGWCVAPAQDNSWGRLRELQFQCDSGRLILQNLPQS